MSNMRKDIEELISSQKVLKEKILLDELKVPSAVFNNIVYYEGMDFDSLSEPDLILSHAYLHKSYGMKNPTLEKKTIKKIHKGLKVEMLKRNQKHVDFDELDRDNT